MNIHSKASKITLIIFFSTLFLLWLGSALFSYLNPLDIRTTVPSFTISFSDKQGVLDFLREIDFWGDHRVKLRDRQIYGQAVTVKRIRVIVTQDTYGSGGYIDSSNKVIYSNQEDFKNGLLTIYIGVAPEYWSDLGKLSRLIKTELLMAAYELVEPVNYFKTTKMNEVLESKYNQQYIKITNSR